MSAAPWARGRLRGLLYRPPSHRPVPGRPHYRFRARRGPGALRLPGLADVTPGGFLLLIGGHDASSRPARLPIIEGSNRRAGTTVRSDKKKFPNDRWRYAPSHLPARRPSSELTANACFPLGRPRSGGLPAAHRAGSEPRFRRCLRSRRRSAPGVRPPRTGRPRFRRPARRGAPGPDRRERVHALRPGAGKHDRRLLRAAAVGVPDPDSVDSPEA